MIILRQKRKWVERINRLKATPFQKKVWKILLTIPKGEVRSYSWVAEKVGSPRATRAVGNALNKNPLAPDVPCHRVIRKDGSWGGYAKELAQKKALLKKEGYFLK
jgi:O-6-methylguanine DNA methyltransferase